MTWATHTTNKLRANPLIMDPLRGIPMEGLCLPIQGEVNLNGRVVRMKILFSKYSTLHLCLGKLSPRSKPICLWPILKCMTYCCVQSNLLMLIICPERSYSTCRKWQYNKKRDIACSTWCILRINLIQFMSRICVTARCRSSLSLHQMTVDIFQKYKGTDL